MEKDKKLESPRRFEILLIVARKRLDEREGEGEREKEWKRVEKVQFSNKIKGRGSVVYVVWRGNAVWEYSRQDET